jgi:riboflavin synthase
LDRLRRAPCPSCFFAFSKLAIGSARVFSGLIEHWGSVVELRQSPVGGLTLVIAAPSVRGEDVALGESIAVDGVCLTLTAQDGYKLSFEVVPETLDRSTVGAYEQGQRVNLELSLRLGDRLGGHLVYAHVDARVRLLEKRREGQGFRVTFEKPARLARFVVEKGYVALDGVSLTVASAGETKFTVALIPATAELTTFAERTLGSEVNLEIDPIARYVDACAAPYLRKSA